MGVFVPLPKGLRLMVLSMFQLLFAWLRRRFMCRIANYFTSLFLLDTVKVGVIGILKNDLVIVKCQWVPLLWDCAFNSDDIHTVTFHLS